MTRTASTTSLAAMALCVAGCVDGLSQSAQNQGIGQTAPPGAAEGTCWDQRITPAVIETVTEQILVHPPEILSDGSVSRPAIYRTETRQVIVRDRSVAWSEIVCSADLTDEFIASVQRALAARGLYFGGITGRLDDGTRRAVQAYQKRFGLDSDQLTMAAARALGLVATLSE